jgi:two-component sensor histidine kinase
MTDGKDRAGDEAGDAGEAGSGAVSPMTGALLHEVDHRVKNNLQLISSIILLQSRRAADPGVRVALRGALERVAAVAAVHRRLFQGDPMAFDVAEFARDLTGDLAGSAGRDDLQIVLELEDVTIPASSAAPFALVFNELLGNALKHAFPPGRAGRITVSLANRGEAYVLTIADDGVGMGDASPGFGSMIVKLLSQQLHANLQISDGQPGVRATVTIPADRAVAP